MACEEVVIVRKLASIQIIWKIDPIDGADRIELAHVLGWQCVVNKGQFANGDLAVYFEIDSFLPIRDVFEFLRKSSYANTDIMGEGFRLKTQKFKGVISQGLLMPISAFPELRTGVWLGADVTELLGVKKWEIEQRVTTGGTVKGELPSCVPHTDETRVQTMPELISEFGEMEYYISTKMDGSSHSIAWDDDGFHVTGHNFEYADDGKSDFYEFIKSRGYGQKLHELYVEEGLKTFVVQGEFCGPGIQKNRLRLVKPEWYVFTVMKNGRRVGLKEMVKVCELLGCEHVPIEEVGRCLSSLYPNVDSLLERADGDYPNGGKKEGIVIRPCFPIYSDRIGGNLSMKVVSNKYLVKNE